MEPLIERQFFSQLIKEVQRDNITAIIGPRQVGKTTLITQIKDYLSKKDSHGKPFVTLNFDRLEHRELMLKSHDMLERYIENTVGMPLSKLEQKIYLIIDEAQKVKLVFERIKILYDNFKSKIKIILTGSSTLELLDSSVETLAGRIHYFKVPPFSLKETLIAKGIVTEKEDGILTQLMSGRLRPKDIREKEIYFYKKKNEILKILQDALIWGTFPELCFFKSQEDRLLFLANYKETYLEKDVRQLEYIQDLQTYSHLLELLAVANGNVLQYNQLARDLGISFPTLKKYISLIDASFLNFSLTPFSHSQRRRIIKSPKHYYIDNGLVSYLSDYFDYNGLVRSGIIGNRFESFFVNQIRNCAQHILPSPVLFYWRTTGGIEVDLILRHHGNLVPIEFKYTSNVDFKTVKPISHFMEVFPEITGQGLVVYNGDFQQIKDKNILWLPAYLVF